jgi:hypothetical protein
MTAGMVGVLVGARLGRLLAFPCLKPYSRVLWRPGSKRAKASYTQYIATNRPLSSVLKLTSPSSAMPTGPSNSIPAPVAPLNSTSGGDRKPRTLILCFDGTANSYNASVTNVVKLYSLLSKDKVEDQMCYYQVSAPFYCLPISSRVCRREWERTLSRASLSPCFNGLRRSWIRLLLGTSISM